MGLVSSVVVLTAALVAVTYAAPASTGRILANNGFLMTLWQVQAAAVSLALAMAVFVFGLVPRSGTRVSYRTFLRRSLARVVMVTGISSMLLDGAVLVGLGHQLPNRPGTNDGHGWAVSVASAAGLLSIASIALLFGRTIGALDPRTSATALGNDRRATIGQALRGELLSEFAYTAMETAADRLDFEFIPGYYRDGIQMRAPHTGGAVRNVRLRRVAVLGRRARRANQAVPLIHVWPGQRLVPGAPMITIDARTRLIGRLRARRCVRVRAVPTDDATVLLDTLHADVLEHIRSDRPVDALAGMQAMTEMLQLAWQAEQAHRQAPREPTILQLALFRTRGFAEQVTRRLTTEVRAGALSADEQIRDLTAQLPRQLAALALQAGAAESVRACLTLYLSLYDAIVSDVTDAGRLPVPQSGVGRRRITQVFTAVLSFTQADVLSSLERARRTQPGSGTARWLAAELNAALFAVEQSATANATILAMLRRALTLGDLLSVQRVLPHWSEPDAGGPLSDQRASNESADGAARLDTALLAQSRELAGMKLRLLRTVLQFEQRNNRSSSDSGDSVGDIPAIPDPAVLAVLDSLQPATFWASLTTATRQADQDLFPEIRDDEVRPDGWHSPGWSAPGVGLTEAFVRAALARPNLVSGGAPDQEYALDHAHEFTAAVSTVLSAHLQWAQRYGAGQDMRERAEEMLRLMRKANLRARRAAARRALSVPIPDATTPALRDAAAQHYAAHDVIGPLFAWARRPARLDPPIDGQAIPVLHEWDRDTFTGPGASLQHAGKALGTEAARLAIGALLQAAIAQRPARRVNREHAAERVRDEIAALRARRAAHPDLDPAAPGIVIFVPADHEIADVLGVTDRARGTNPSHPDTNPPVREHLLAQLGLATPQLGWSLLGLVDLVPVIRHACGMTRIVVLDLAYGIAYRTKGGAGAQAGSLSHVALLPASEHSARQRRAGTRTAGADPAEEESDEQITRMMTVVQVKADLAISFALEPGAGVGVLELAT